MNEREKEKIVSKSLELFEKQLRGILDYGLEGYSGTLRFDEVKVDISIDVESTY